EGGGLGEDEQHRGGALHHSHHHHDEEHCGEQHQAAPERAVPAPCRGGGSRAHVEAPLKIPVGRTSRVMTRITKATVTLYSVGTSARLAGSAMPSGRMALSGRSTAVQLKTASVSAKAMRKPPTMAP